MWLLWMIAGAVAVLALIFLNEIQKYFRFADSIGFQTRHVALNTLLLNHFKVVYGRDASSNERRAIMIATVAMGDEAAACAEHGKISGEMAWRLFEAISANATNIDHEIRNYNQSQSSQNVP